MCKGAMQVTQAVLPGMVERKSGQIINLCGVLGVKTIANAALYCATKHALVGWGGALAQELKRSNIRVTSLCCSGVDSPFWEGVPGKPRAEMLLQPADVAHEIVSLIAQPAHVIANQVLVAAHRASTLTVKEKGERRKEERERKKRLRRLSPFLPFSFLLHRYETFTCHSRRHAVH